MRPQSAWYAICLHLLLLFSSLSITHASPRGLPHSSLHRRTVESTDPSPSTADTYLTSRAEPAPKPCPEVYAAALQRPHVEKTVTGISIRLAKHPEVVSWKVYKTTQYQLATVQIRELPRTGDETSFEYAEYASYIIVEAINSEGKPLGSSAVTESVPPINIHTEEFSRELGWLQDAEQPRPLPPLPPRLNATGLEGVAVPEQLSHESGPPGDTAALLQTSAATFSYGALCGLAFVILWRIRRSVAPRVPVFAALFGSATKGTEVPGKIY